VGWRGVGVLLGAAGGAFEDKGVFGREGRERRVWGGMREEGGGG